MDAVQRKIADYQPEQAVAACAEEDQSDEGLGWIGEDIVGSGQVEWGSAVKDLSLVLHAQCVVVGDYSGEEDDGRAAVAVEWVLKVVFEAEGRFWPWVKEDKREIEQIQGVEEQR